MNYPQEISLAKKRLARLKKLARLARKAESANIQLRRQLDLIDMENKKNPPLF
jgi:hypothetical protein